MLIHGAQQAAAVTNSDTKQFGEYQIDVKKLIAYPKATEEMLEDYDYDIEALIMDDATMGFAEGEAYGFLLGNGVLQPRGLDDCTNSIHRRQYPCLGYCAEV